MGGPPRTGLKHLLLPGQRSGRTALRENAVRWLTGAHSPLGQGWSLGRGVRGEALQTWGGQATVHLVEQAFLLTEFFEHLRLGPLGDQLLGGVRDALVAVALPPG